MRNGYVWAQTTWAPHTTANGSGYWPTPNVPNGGRTTWHAEQAQGSFYHDGKKVQFGLEQAVRMWPTPDASDWKQDGLAASQRHLDLSSTVSLNAAVRLWATPTGNTAKNNGATSQQGRHGPTLDVQVGGSLSPDWVDWLMGWPQGWSGRGPLNLEAFRVWLAAYQTALHAYAPSATVRCPCARSSPGAF